MKKEDAELYYQLQELFDIAWDLNINKNTPTELSKKVVRYAPSIMQQFSYLCDAVEGKEEMRKAAWEEGFNQGHIKGVQDLAGFTQGFQKEEQ